MKFVISAAEQTRRELAALNHKPAAEVRAANPSPQETVKQLKAQFATVMASVAQNRKQIYAILVDLKEHYHEYGYNCPRAAVEDVCQRSKTWANDFMLQVEAEAEIDKVTGRSVASPDLPDKKEQKALSRVEAAREAEPEPESNFDTATESKPQNNGHTPRSEIGKPKSELAVWKTAEEAGGAFLRAVDAVHKTCPSHIVHERIICGIKSEMEMLQRWREAT